MSKNAENQQKTYTRTQIFFMNLPLRFNDLANCIETFLIKLTTLIIIRNSKATCKFLGVSFDENEFLQGSCPVKIKDKKYTFNFDINPSNEEM
ncbi:MAG: hypothetical protein IJE79_00815 [Alphaproteobacteria bacterium]|nr:hypothetical protein [Alphaproteobacteria bacterium]